MIWESVGANSHPNQTNSPSQVPEVKRVRGASEGDEETVTTALPRDDESPHNVDDKVATFWKKNVQMQFFFRGCLKIILA